jgi:fido (protein-threonine AMPylation protein)
MNEIELSRKDIIAEISNLKEKVDKLGDGTSSLLKIAQESFIIGSKSHLNSLNPEIREELGLELDFMTQEDPKLKASYINKKNQYLSLGKSYASINFLFDLVDIDFNYLDLLLLHEILMDNGEFRKTMVFIQHPDGTKIEFNYENIPEDVQKIFEWYEASKTNEKISPIVLASLFHYKLVSIHPFLDGNGRISRLILNLILLKNGYFPISIPNEKRKEYYESLVDADNGNFDTLILYLSSLIKEKLEQYLLIANELSKIDDKKEYLVLTEDGNTSMITKILKIHQFDLEKVQVESYDGKDNLASAIFFANKLFNKSKNLKRILIHQDRDNNNPQQLQQIINKYLRSYGLDSVTIILITKFYDIESYFLNEKHINSLFSAISIERAKELISHATNETSEISKRKLRQALSQFGKYGKMEDPQEKAKEINSLYDSEPEKYRYGKEVLYKLEELITKELNLTDRASLSSTSNHIKINEFEKLKQ